MLRVCHRHIVRIIDDVLIMLFFFAVVPAFFYYNGSFGLSNVEFKYFEAYMAAVYLFLLYRIFNWYNDAWIITESGIVDISWNIYTQNITYIEYHSIHGVSIRRASFFDSMIGKGDVVIELAGEEENDAEFALFDASDPEGIVDEIQSRLHHNEENEEDIEDDRAPFEVLMETLTDMVREHMQKKGVYTTPEEDEETRRQVELALRRKSTIDLTREDS